MPRNPFDPPGGTEGSLEARTVRLVREFDNAGKDHAFNDSGGGTSYAEWFADLLEEWVIYERRRG